MRSNNGNYLYESSCPGGKRTKMKTRCSSAECKCSPPIVNVHHYQCPLMKTPCPLHGYPFIYNLKSKKTPPDQCLVISFHPSLKSDKLFEPVKTFLNQTCDPDTKINFQYYSPRLSLSETADDFRHRQVQTNPEDFKKLNGCFVEKTKTFFSDKTNKMKKLKQCFNSPCSSVVYKSRSCTSVREKVDRVFREGTADGNTNKSKLEKRMKGGCCMKSEESSHLLYKRDFDLSDGEKSGKEKINSDFITKINDNLLDHNIFEIRPRRGVNEKLGRASGSMRPHFTYTSFVSPDPIKEKAPGHKQTEEISDLERNNEGSQNPDDHLDELKEVKEEHDKSSPDENISSESSGSVYFTPFILVPGGNDKEVEHQGIQTVPKMSCQWVQTIEYFRETVNNKNQTEKSKIIVAKAEFIKTKETQTPPILMPEACVCREPLTTPDKEGEEEPIKTNVAARAPQQRHSAPLFSDFNFFGNIEALTKAPGVKQKRVEAIAPVSMGIQTQETPSMSTVIYYEPEMKFLRREERPEDEAKSVEAVAPVSVGTQTQEAPSMSTVIYYEPEMKFLRREERPDDEAKSVEAVGLVSVGTQTQETPSMSTVIYYEPEMKFLEREERPEDEVKSVEAAAPVSVGTRTKEKPSLRTVVFYEPEMKFLRKEENSGDGKKGVEVEKTRSMGVQTEEKTSEKKTSSENKEKLISKGVQIQETRSLSTLSFIRTGRTSPRANQKYQDEEPKKNVEAKVREIPTVVYYEPEMKFLNRAKSSESVMEEQALSTIEGQAQSVVEPASRCEPVTVIYFEPELKPLRRKDESGKRGVLFNEKTQVKEIDTGTKDECVGTEPETLQESTSQNKEIQATSETDTSQSYFDGSDSSNLTYVIKSYVTEESEQVVVKNWIRSRSDGDMLEKKKCDCLTKADQGQSYQLDGTNPDAMTFVGVYRSKKETIASQSPQDWTKAQQARPERTVKKNEDSNASFADLSDLIRIIDENFKKMFDRTIGKCQCQQIKETKPTANKEIMTDISGANGTDVILQMTTRSMANAQIQASLPVLREMPLGQSNNPDQEPPTSVCKVCSKVISMKTMNVGTNTPNGSYIQTKMQQVSIGTYSESFPIEKNQKPSTSKPDSEKPSTSKGKSGGIKSVRVSTKSFVTKFENPPESSENRAPAPARRRNITYPEPFSDSTSSLQRDLRRAQQECGVKPKSSRPTPPPRSRPTPSPRQIPPTQSRPQMVTRVIPDGYCGNIVATITTRQTPSTQVQERCPFEPSPIHCEKADFVCPQPKRSNPDSCSQRTQPKKEPDSKQNHMTYHVTLSPLWSKDIMKIFQRKLKKISKSESSVCVSNSIGKQKRNHDAGSDGGPTVKRIKSSEREKANVCDTNQLEHACFEINKSQADILFKVLTKGESELDPEEEIPRLIKNSGFVWIPSFPAPKFFSIRQVSSSEETAKPKETLKQLSRGHSQVLSKIPEENNRKNSSTKDACQQNLNCAAEKNLIRKLFRCSSCKSLTYLQRKNSEITENPKNNSTNFKSSVEECFKNLMFTSQSHSLVETDKLINSEQGHVEAVPSTETCISSSSSEETYKFLYELCSKFLSEKSDSPFEMDTNQEETCPNSKLPSLKSDKGFIISSSNKLSFQDSSPDVSTPKRPVESECNRTFRFSAGSSTAVPDSKKTILKKFPSKIFRGSRKKSK